MTDTSNITVPSVDELKKTVLPGLFLDARAISHYGDSAVSSGAMDRYSSMMEKNAVTELARTLSGIVSALVHADPQRIDSKPSWLSRFTGKHLETQVRYLKSANSGSSDKMPLINYVVAQVSIKDGETDIDLVKSVVDTYKAGTSVTEIPDNIRYALEMAAFGKAVTPAAVSYEDIKNDLARNYSGFGKSSFFTGGILTLIGFLILVWVRRLNQRVQFLNNYAIR